MFNSFKFLQLVTNNFVNDVGKLLIGKSTLQNVNSNNCGKLSYDTVDLFIVNFVKDFGKLVNRIDKLFIVKLFKFINFSIDLIFVFASLSSNL